MGFIGKARGSLHASSWPGSSRPSTSFFLVASQDVDARHKAGHDEDIRRECYSVTVCTTAPTVRLEIVGSFASFTSIASYSGKVSSGALAFICTTL
jgi:hypothetical protein